MIRSEWIKECVVSSRYFYSKHGDLERQNDNLSINEIEQALLQGSVLERYADTGRGESCLMVGFTTKGKPIHVVCGKRGDSLVVITVYVPSPPKFRTPYERG
jgi:hypothetical protein